MQIDARKSTLVRRQKRKRIVKLSFRFVVMFGLAALFIYQFFFLQFIKMPTGTMANTIISGDHLIVKKRAFGEINRGDLIVFRYSDDPSEYYLARVIGLPLETIQMRGRILYINNRELPERRVFVKPDFYLKSGIFEELSSEGTGSYNVFFLIEGDEVTSSSEGVYGTSEPFQIPDNHYFVMSDNRDNSLDSRFRGPVARESIFGKPTAIYWSAYVNDSGDYQIRWERIFNTVR